MNIATKQNPTFDEIRQITEDGREFWSARDLQIALNYQSWDKFRAVLLKAMEACKNSNIDVTDHFPQTGKMIATGKGAQRKAEDYHLPVI